MVKTRDPLEKLFGSVTRLKLLRLFILNPETIFDSAVASRHIKRDRKSVSGEFQTLWKAGFVKKLASKKKQPGGYILDSSFPFLKPLQDMLGGAEYEVRKDLADTLSRVGRTKLVVLTGSFVEPQSLAVARDLRHESDVDILVVGDNISRRSVAKAVEMAEEKLGRELGFALLETADFVYRMQMFDRFVRDILDAPHEFLINKLDL